jgi:hypothetical protein
MAVAASYDFGRHRSILDVAGGTGSFLVHVLRRNSSLKGTLFELPGACAVARQKLAELPEGARINIIRPPAMSAFDPKRTSAAVGLCNANWPLNPIPPAAKPWCNCSVALVPSLRGRQCDDAISFKELRHPRRGRSGHARSSRRCR